MTASQSHGSAQHHQAPGFALWQVHIKQTNKKKNKCDVVKFCVRHRSLKQQQTKLYSWRMSFFFVKGMMVFMAIEPNLNPFDSFESNSCLTFIIGHLRFKVRCWYNLIRPAKCHKLKVSLLTVKYYRTLRYDCICCARLSFKKKKSDLQTWSWTWTCVLPSRWWLWPNSARSHQRDAVLSGIPLDVPQQQRVRVGDHGSPWQPVALSLCRAGHRGQGLPGQLPPPLQRHRAWQEWDRWEGREWCSSANTGRCIKPGHGSVLTCWGWKWKSNKCTRGKCGLEL